MSWLRMRAIAAQDLRVLRRDPTFLIVMTLMPLILMEFLKPGARGALAESGVHVANGAELVVPGMSMVFAFFSVAMFGFSVFREHGWHTWERLRATPIRASEMMIGKSIVPVLSLTAQLCVFFGIGGWLYGLHVKGSVIALMLVAASLDVNIICIALLLIAVCRTVMQLNGIVNLGAILFAGLGGALAPVSDFPGWAQAIARFTPGYWAMEGFRTVIINGGDLGDVLRPVAVLGAFSLACALIAWRRFRVDEPKTVAWV